MDKRILQRTSKGVSVEQTNKAKKKKGLLTKYKDNFGEPPPMLIIDGESEIENAIKTGKQITEKSKGWNGQGTFF